MAILARGAEPGPVVDLERSAGLTLDPRSGDPGRAPATLEERVQDLLVRMTLDEKISMIAGNGRDSGGDGFASRPVPRLGIPAFLMTDGPVGVRWDRSTAFPASINMAATWNPGMVRRLGVALARETKGHGRNVLLGPCVNIHRVPQGGRNFESFGEDPYLASCMAVAYIRGVQSESVVATVKHFAANNQETDRGHIDVRVSERALHEIYFPAFRASVVEAGVWSVMSAYNKVNGAWCSENPFLLDDILKEEWGFQGFVMSDWGAVHSALPTARAGLDIEMPEDRYLNGSLRDALRSGDWKEEILDDKVRRILRVLIATGIFDGQVRGKPADVNSVAHRALVRDAGAASIVLLKNERDILPIPRTVKRIAVIGPNAAVARYGGGGSSRVTPFSSVSPLEALRARCGDKIAIEYEVGCPMDDDMPPVPSSCLRPPAGGKIHGLRGEYFTNMNCEGVPAFTRVDAAVDFQWGAGSPAVGFPADHFSVRWTGRLAPRVSGEYQLGVGADDGIRLYLDGRIIVDHWSNHSHETRRVGVSLEADRTYDVKIEYYENRGDASARFGWLLPRDRPHIDSAVEIAGRADMVLLFVGLTEHIESEGTDRADLHLPEGQDALIEAVAAANPKTVVVLQSGAPVIMESWIDRVAALAEAWYPGEECGNSIADILFGDVNPSARLPTTFFRRAEDVPSLDNFPGDHVEVRYDEGLYVGYRHFDRAGIEPLYPFGHGLSYTKFDYRNASIRATGENRFEVTLEVGNTGDRSGAEVVQCYVAAPDAPIERPPKELKAFQRVELSAGERKKITLALGPESFAYWDPSRRQWTVAPGKYRLLIGASSREIRWTGEVEVK